ncbi:MAG TPA: hypothetical protein VEQ42_12010 [Pyrinomonadaceae bacterium]|nr:hypothetical protein [Pyrinomonadaceae bacterium]
MHMTPLLLFAQAATEDQVFHRPAYFAPVLVLLLAGGALGWLVAAIIGFARARAFGVSTRWFALSAVCLLLFHAQLLLLGFAMIQNNIEMLFGVAAFLDLFILLGSVCAIIGFVKLTDPRSR